MVPGIYQLYSQETQSTPSSTTRSPGRHQQSSQKSVRCSAVAGTDFISGQNQLPTCTAHPTNTSRDCYPETK
ncbi:hypothetical protein NQZ68_019314 [Dissostichus eleginoides]|nr:hypothetical protein NQZ68_019314 [Dissostichus eleginoides]